jgi:RNA polymerase sigma-70 factor (ECF subfamily)
MGEECCFRDLIRRVRAGDEAAAAQLVRLYEPTIRLIVRRRLTNPAVRRLLDSVDICQSVLASFFVRAAAGQYDLDQPDHLLKLLARMACNKLANAVMKQHAARRHPARAVAVPLRDSAVVDPGQSPSEQIANQDLLQQVRSRLSRDELELVERRACGLTWAEIAAQLGGNADALRIRHGRAVERVARELGLEE